MDCRIARVLIPRAPGPGVPRRGCPREVEEALGDERGCEHRPPVELGLREPLGGKGLATPSGTARGNKNSGQAWLGLQRAAPELNRGQHPSVTHCPRAGVTTGVAQPSLAAGGGAELPECLRRGWERLENP